MRQLNDIFREKVRVISQDIIDDAKRLALPFRFRDSGLSSESGWLMQPMINGYIISPTLENEESLYHNVYGASEDVVGRFISWEELSNYPSLKNWVEVKMGPNRGVRVRPPGVLGMRPSLGSKERHFLGLAYRYKLLDMKN